MALVTAANARAELEGWLVTHVGSAEAEEAWRLINNLINAERKSTATAENAVATDAPLG